MNPMRPARRNGAPYKRARGVRDRRIDRHLDSAGRREDGRRDGGRFTIPER